MVRAAVAFCLIGLFAGAYAACDDGWGGLNCNFCQNDAACVKATGDPEATCSTDLAFAPTSELKALQCTIQDAAASQFIDPNSLALLCAVGNDTAWTYGRRLLAEEMTATCELSLKLKISTANVTCTADQCAISPDGFTINCKTTACACAPADCGLKAIADVLKGVSGAAGVTCDSTGACTVTISGLSVLPGGGKLKTTCKSAECLPGSEQ